MDCNFEVNDATPAALARFRDFLRGRYPGEAALRAAWRDPDVSFDTALPESLADYAARTPTWRARLLADDPDTSVRRRDSKRFLEIAFQETMLDFCRWIKEATHGRALAGARTGDFMANQWNLSPGGIKENDCNPIDLLLADPSFDFFDTQPPYLGRHRLGTQGAGTPHLPTAALAARNKLLIIQDDLPHLVKPRPDTHTLREMKRLTACYSLFNHAYPYQFEMSHYKLNLPELVEEENRAVWLYDRAIRAERHSVADVAVVLDLEYQRFLGLDEHQRAPARTAALLDHLKWTWNRAGVAFDLVALQDLPKLRDYKLYVFANTFDGSPAKERIVANAVKRDGKVAVFLWADGYFGAAKHDTEAMGRFIGMRVNASDTRRAWAMTPTADFPETVSDRFPLGRLTDTAPGEQGASDWSYAPSFTVTDPDATPLATYTGTADVAIAVKRHPEWTAVYNASVVASPALLRYAAKLAGCFRYGDGEDIFYANASFIALHAQDDGEWTLRLPSATSLFEVYTQCEIPAATEFRFSKTKNRTQLYFRGDRAAWERLAPDGSPSISAWREPEAWEKELTTVQGRDAASGALWEARDDGGYRFHVPWKGKAFRLLVALPNGTEWSGSVQVFDKRSDGIGVGLARRTGTVWSLLQRHAVSAGPARNLSFSAPADDNGEYWLLFDDNGQTQFDTSELRGFSLPHASRAVLLDAAKAPTRKPATP